MSTAFYKSKTKPQLLATFLHQHNRSSNSHKKSIQIWTTPCIVHQFGKNQKDTSFCNALINPSNPELSGVSNFPYFPRGGPVPESAPKSMHKDWKPMGYVSSWGGMEVGDGMLYPVSVVDGLVHQLGGPKLKFECKMINIFKGGCPIGTAVETSQGSEELKIRYERILHVTPPFYKNHDNDDDHDPIATLDKCYTSAFDLAFHNATIDEEKEYRVACPLLGAGGRGFPNDVAMNVAAHAGWKWLRKNEDSNDGNKKSSVVAFGIPDPQIANLFVQEFNTMKDSNSDNI